MNDNPILGFIVIVLAMLVGYAINVIHRRKKEPLLLAGPCSPDPSPA